MKFTALLIVAVAICAASALAADQAINIESGDTITVSVDTGFHVGKVSEIAATYEIADLDFSDEVVVRDPKTGTITRDLTITAPQGTYLLLTTLYVNKKVSKTEEILLTVLPQGARSDAPGSVTTPPPSPPTTTLPQPTQPVGPRAQILIPRIPDIEPGTTFLVPVTIRGDGIYTVEVPRLDYGTYDVPEYVEVHGEKSFGILLHISPDATPGVYTFQVSSGADSASTRIRIIKYHRENYWWYLIPIGILLIILGILLLFQFKRKQPFEPRRPQPPKNDNDKPGDLITYY